MVFKSQLPDSIPPSKFNNLVSNYFWHQLDVFSERTLLVDYASGRQWTGNELKQTCGQIARNLLDEHILRPEQDCIFFLKNNSQTHLLALAVLFAGSSVCVLEPNDPEQEQEYTVRTLRPAAIFINAHLSKRMRDLRTKLAENFKIIIMDDDDGYKLDQDEFGFNSNLLRKNNNNQAKQQDRATQLPVQVAPSRPAFVLFTSGSTGLPKPVGRSQKNSLYTCFLLPEQTTSHLWPLNKDSILAGQLQLDHGTGIFTLKMTLAKGLKLIIMENYEYKMMLNSIERYKITDLMLGSALLHNLINDHLSKDIGYDLSSLRSVTTIGSPIASYDAIGRFMRKYPQCSVRQAFGMTEFSFVSLNKYGESIELQERKRTVGQLLPNVRIKLMSRDEPIVEIDQFNTAGELYLSGPTMSSGYLGEQFREQTARSFLSDGYYKSSDMAMMYVDNTMKESDDNCFARAELRIVGRYSEVLVLYDGWKVLPSEIEQIIMEHPQVVEAAVVGVPHPELPTCHAPRAYVVQRESSNNNRATTSEQNSNGTTTTTTNNNNNNNNSNNKPLTEQELFDFVAQRCAQPKHLVGGIKFVDELPRISIGKVDKKLLKQRDGYA